MLRVLLTIVLGVRTLGMQMVLPPLADHVERLGAIAPSVNGTLGSAVSNVSSAGWLALTVGQMRLELDAPPSEPVNKLALALINGVGLGAVGLDRCYMGQPMLGLVKGLTAGGFFLWAVADYFVILANCLGQFPSIHTLGYHADFAESSVAGGCCVSFALLVVSLAWGATRKEKKPSWHD